MKNKKATLSGGPVFTEKLRNLLESEPERFEDGRAVLLGHAKQLAQDIFEGPNLINLAIVIGDEIDQQEGFQLWRVRSVLIAEKNAILRGKIKKFFTINKSVTSLIFNKNFTRHNGHLIFIEINADILGHAVGKQFFMKRLGFGILRFGSGCGEEENPVSFRYGVIAVSNERDALEIFKIGFVNDNVHGDGAL